MIRISDCSWTTLVAVAALAAVSLAERASPAGTDGPPAEQPQAEQQIHADEPSDDEPATDEVQGPIPVQPADDEPLQDEQIQDFLLLLKDLPRPEFDVSDSYVVSELADQPDRPKSPAPQPDQQKGPRWRQAQLRPQEGLTRWLDFDAYGGPIVDYDVRHYPRGGVNGQPGRLDMTRHHFAAGYLTSDWPALRFNARLNWLQLRSDATLPDGRKLPSHLMDVQAEFFVPWPLPFSEFSIAFGSASDKPFASGDEMFVDITWLTAVPAGDDGQVLLLINFNTNREFLNGLPVGGVAYRYHDEKADNLRLVVGFPYSGVRWKATDWLQINAEYEFPRTVHTRVDFLCGRGVRLYGGFDWTNERFALHDRMEKDDRLFYYEQRLTAGARWDINDEMFIDFSGGWAFDRFFFEGRGYQDRDDNRLNIKDGPFIGLTFGYSF